MSFETSALRRGFDLLLSMYPHFDVVTVDLEVGHPVWAIVELGQPSEGESDAYAIWRFAIWRTTGAVHRMSDGAVEDDPIIEPQLEIEKGGVP